MNSRWTHNNHHVYTQWNSTTEWQNAATYLLESSIDGAVLQCSSTVIYRNESRISRWLSVPSLIFLYRIETSWEHNIYYYFDLTCHYYILLFIWWLKLFLLLFGFPEVKLRYNILYIYIIFTVPSNNGNYWIVNQDSIRSCLQ